MAPTKLKLVTESTGTEPSPPETLEDFLALYVEALAADAQALRQLKGYQLEERRLSEALYAASAEGDAERQLRLIRDAGRMLAGETVVDVSDLQSQHARAQRLCEVAQEARRQTQSRVEKLRKKCGTQLSMRAKPAHRVAVRRIARALVELSAAVRAEAEIRAGIERSGFPVNAPSLPSMAWNLVGNANDRNSSSGMWLQEARRLGFVAKDEDVRRLEVEA